MKHSTRKTLTVTATLLSLSPEDQAALVDVRLVITDESPIREEIGIISDGEDQFNGYTSPSMDNLPPVVQRLMGFAAVELCVRSSLIRLPDTDASITRREG